MKEYLLLYKTKLNNYFNLEKYPKSKLLDLFIFASEDYSALQIDICTRELNLYNTTYVYNDCKNHVMYIGFGEWFIDEDIDGPSWEEYPNYVNETNSCKITHDNFNEFIKQWIQLKKDLPSFALIYRDNLDWVACKGFDMQEAMEAFVKNYKDEVVH
ncbi:MAG: hypothetical protein ACXVHO_09270 [Methanobacterium sp.]